VRRLFLKRFQFGYGFVDRMDDGYVPSIVFQPLEHNKLRKCGLFARQFAFPCTSLAAHGKQKIWCSY
jgi:hypothetical protein